MRNDHEIPLKSSPGQFAARKNKIVSDLYSLKSEDKKIPPQTAPTVSEGFSSHNFSREDEMNQAPIEPTTYLTTEDAILTKKPAPKPVSFFQKFKTLFSIKKHKIEPIQTDRLPIMGKSKSQIVRSNSYFSKQQTNVWNQMTEQQRKNRVQLLWHKVRVLLQTKRFIHLTQKQSQAASVITQTVDEEDEKIEKPRWFQIQLGSKFYSRWQFNMSIWLWASVFLVPLVLVWDTILDQTNAIKVILYSADCFFLINILVQFLVIRPKVESLSLWKNAKEYLKTWFLLDLVICLPAVITNQVIWSQWSKLLRFVHSDFSKSVLNKFCSMIYYDNNHAQKQLSSSLQMMVYMFYMCHIFVCLWIYIGDKTWGLLENELPWMLKYPDQFSNDKKYEIYVFSFYWVFTIISTTGYGDYTGSTRIEYGVSMLYEFLGIMFVSFLMFGLSNVMKSSNNFADFQSDKHQELNIWVGKIEKSRQGKYLSPLMYEKICQTLEDAFQFDYNMIIEGFNFYQTLQPRDQNELVNVLFSSFKEKFSHFLEGLEVGFTNEIIVNLYCRTYQSGHEILASGQKNDQLFFILEGSVVIREPSGNKEPFYILPQYSYFGDLNIFNKIISFHSYQAINSDQYEEFVDERFIEERRRGKCDKNHQTPSYAYMNKSYFKNQEHDGLGNEDRIVMMCVNIDIINNLLSIYPRSANILKKRAEQRNQILTDAKNQNSHFNQGAKILLGGLFGGGLMRPDADARKMSNAMNQSVMLKMRQLGSKMVDKLHKVQLYDDSSADLDERLEEIDGAIQRFKEYMTKVIEKDVQDQLTRRNTSQGDSILRAVTFFKNTSENQDLAQSRVEIDLDGPIIPTQKMTSFFPVQANDLPQKIKIEEDGFGDSSSSSVEGSEGNFSFEAEQMFQEEMNRVAFNDDTVRIPSAIHSTRQDESSPEVESQQQFWEESPRSAVQEQMLGVPQRQVIPPSNYSSETNLAQTPNVLPPSQDPVRRRRVHIHATVAGVGSSSEML